MLRTTLGSIKESSFLWGMVPSWKKKNQPVKSHVRKQTSLDFCCGQKSKTFYIWHTHIFRIWIITKEPGKGRKKIGSWQGQRIIASTGPGRWPEIPSSVNCIFKGGPPLPGDFCTLRAHILPGAILLCGCEKIPHLPQKYSNSAPDSYTPAKDKQ